MTQRDTFFVGSDNAIKVEGLQDSQDSSYINDATVYMSIFKETTLNITPGVGVSEVQSIIPNARATAGTYTISYQGQTTGAIPYDASTSVVESFLELLTTLKVGDVDVSGDAFDRDPVASGMIFTFRDTLGDVTALSMTVGSLTGVSSVTVTELTKGILLGDAISAFQSIIPNAQATGGTFTLSYGGQTTANIAYDAAVGTVKTALELLSTVAANDITVAGDTFDTTPVVGGMTFEFADTLGDVTQITIDVSSLTSVSSAIQKESREGRLANIAIDEGGGYVGIPIDDHEMEAGIWIRFQGTKNYDGEYQISSVQQDKIVIQTTYAAETFNGDEVVYEGIGDGGHLPMDYVVASSGDYLGQLPDDIKRVLVDDWYYLFIEVVKADNGGFTRLLVQIRMEGIYYPEP